MPLPPAEPVSPTLKSARRATKEGVLRKSHRGRPFAQGASDRHFVCVGFHVAYFTDASRRTRTGCFDLRDVELLIPSTDPKAAGGVTLTLRKSEKASKQLTVSFAPDPEERGEWLRYWCSAVIGQSVGDDLAEHRDSALSSMLWQKYGVQPTLSFSTPMGKSIPGFGLQRGGSTFTLGRHSSSSPACAVDVAPDTPRAGAVGTFGADTPTEGAPEPSALSDLPNRSARISRRMSFTKSDSFFDISGHVRCHFAAVSQRGYYPDDLEKANQDSHFALPRFGEGGQTAVFGVFDGHGQNGALVSQFVRDQLPERLKIAMAQTPHDVSTACRKAFGATDQLLDNSDIDDTFSGTTAVVALMTGTTLTIANSGDSRVIVGQWRGGKLIAYPLSIDHTPFRLDEYQRVKAAGARVMSADQLAGDREFNDDWEMDMAALNEESANDDPPRLWKRDKNIPGCAFTRSIGDRVARTIGVIPWPETLELEIDTSHEYVIVCSDGVFEFLSNQAVVDIVSKSENSLAACNALVQEAYKLWLQFDYRSDDITAIVVRLEHEHSKPGHAAEAMPARMRRRKSSIVGGSAATSRVTRRRSTAFGVSAGVDFVSIEQMRPTRRAVLSRKTKALMEGNKNAASMPAEPVRVEVVGQLSPPELVRARRAVEGNYLFSGLEEDELDKVVPEFWSVRAASGANIIEQGNRGDWFYVVDSGIMDVYVRDGIGDSRHVFTYDASLPGPAPSFGELALISRIPRAATVRARTDAKLWRLRSRTFRERLEKLSPRAELVRTLRSVRILQSLSLSETQLLAEALEHVQRKEGEVVVEQGEISDTFYIIHKGTVGLTRKSDQGEAPAKLQDLSDGQFFGERALLTDAPRNATVTVLTPCAELYYIGRESFETILGSLENIINNDRRRREKNYYLEQLQAETRQLLTSNVSSYLLASDSGDCAIKDKLSTVVIAESKITEQVYSLRVWSKTRIVEELAQRRMMHSVRMLASLQGAPSLFVPQLICVFEDPNRLFTVYSSCLVCTLNSLRLQSEGGKFDEADAKYLCACCVLALESLHLQDFALRSLCSDTIGMTAEGFAQPVDFGYAKRLSSNEDERSSTVCGVPSYRAPEMVGGDGHTADVDLWALGVLLYEMIVGRMPFEGDTELEVHNRIRQHVGTTAGDAPAALGKDEKLLSFPDEVSDDARDVIDVLLSPDPTVRRAGSGHGLDALRMLPWLCEIDWDSMRNGEQKGDHAESLQARTEKKYKELTSADSAPPGVLDVPVEPTADMLWCDGFATKCAPRFRYDESAAK